MRIEIAPSREEAGRRAAETGRALFERALAGGGQAAAVLATGTSQFPVLSRLSQASLDWSRVTFFHLDEYLDLPKEHPASFRRYLEDRFLMHLRTPPAAIHLIDGEADDPVAECARLGSLIRSFEIDLAFVGVGENGHLAFNDPPADFATEEPFLIVDLDEVCRAQQLGEGWFPSLQEVPRRAISMSIRQIMKARTIICTVPDARKARPVAQAFGGPITPEVPASILQQHADVRVFLDRDSAAGLAATGAVDLDDQAGSGPV